MYLRIHLDDRIAAAAGGVIGSIGCAVTTAVLLRRSARFQAARSALLGRPTAYRLHLHGTGIELAPWERNLVAECVMRDVPGPGVWMHPVTPRPDEGGSLIRDTQVHRSGYGFLGDDIEPESSEPDGCPREPSEDTGMPSEEDAPGACWLPATCGNGHEFEATGFVRLRGNASYTARTGLALRCPLCGGDAEIAPGRYSLRDGTVIREDLSEE